MENMEIWGKVQNTPVEARKPIQAGRLKGMTDINPMWRFKVLTEKFGPCGVGWRYRILNKWLEKGLDNEIKAFVEVGLSFRYRAEDGSMEWSELIPGVGGSSFVTVERNGPYCSDECYKMALTDAISVCCKALGMSADIYFEKDRDKYTAGDDTSSARQSRAPSPQGEGFKPAADNGPAPGRQTQMDGVNVGTCKRCRKTVPIRELEYGKERFGHALCRECQAGYAQYLKDKETAAAG